MPNARHALLALAAWLVVAACLAPAALAADPLVVAGTVSRDGAPVAGASVTVLVDGTDTVMPATSDGTGAWQVTVDAASGDTLSIGAGTSTSATDAAGCVRTETATGRMSVAVDALPASVDVVLDTVRTATVCAATATPDSAITPPPTDAAMAGGRRGGDASALLALLGLAAGVATWAARPARRARGPRDRS
jgi:hypothetical protein